MRDPNTPSTDVPIRDAATMIVLRRDAGRARVLMGQRGAGAVFMPNKFVFPGGRLDDTDAEVPLARPVAEPLSTQLSKHSPPLATALVAGAIRELYEETGLRLGAPPDTPVDLPPGWEAFARTGLIPDPGPLTFVFRAVTPPGRPRRFDARFFMAPAEAVAGDLDDFSEADDELRHLSWVPLEEAADLNLPFITRIVLSELETRLSGPATARPVPFFDHSESFSRFLAL